MHEFLSLLHFFCIFCKIYLHRQTIYFAALSSNHLIHKFRRMKTLSHSFHSNISLNGNQNSDNDGKRQIWMRSNWNGKDHFSNFVQLFLMDFVWENFMDEREILKITINLLMNECHNANAIVYHVIISRAHFLFFIAKRFYSNELMKCLFYLNLSSRLLCVVSPFDDKLHNDTINR